MQIPNTPAEEENPESKEGGAVSSRKSPSAMSQNVLFLCTVVLMFAAARFVLPILVEEIRYGWHRGQLRAEYEVSGEGLRNVSLDTLSKAYQMVTQRVRPSVVHIEVERPMLNGQNTMASHGAVAFESTDQGSGIIADSDGFILTNEHVVAGGASITVGLNDGRQLPAYVVGVDSLTDLAVLKIDATNLIPIRFADSEQIRVGSPVWAVGSPFGLDSTVTFGILSGKHRDVKIGSSYQDFMQSDVAVNPGNSGGPLVDIRGELIGVNTAIVGDTYRGVSFSVPSQIALQVYQRIREHGFVERGWLGVGLAAVPSNRTGKVNQRVPGAMVASIVSGNSPAAIAGVRTGDILKTVDGQPINDVGHLIRIVGSLKAGSRIELQLVRDGILQTLPVTINARPAELASR